jgi:predicted DNA-binding transcriptional regulator AlpA
MTTAAAIKVNAKRMVRPHPVGAASQNLRRLTIGPGRIPSAGAFFCQQSEKPMTSKRADAPARPRRLLGARDAAHYLGISATFFLDLVEKRELPRARRLGRRRLWDVLDLDAAADALPYDGDTDQEEDSFKDWQG